MMNVGIKYLVLQIRLNICGEDSLNGCGCLQPKIKRRFSNIYC